MRILVVDDDSLAGEMIGAVLEALDHEVLLAADGVAAMEQLNAEPTIGLIVSDMNMPLLSGIDLFRELREQGVMLPFILLTGDDPEPLLAEEPRLNACLLKDMSLEDQLPEALARAMAPTVGGSV